MESLNFEAFHPLNFRTMSEITKAEDKRVDYLMAMLKKHEAITDKIKVELRSIIYKIEKGR